MSARWMPGRMTREEFEQELRRMDQETERQYQSQQRALTQLQPYTVVDVSPPKRIQWSERLDPRSWS